MRVWNAKTGELLREVKVYPDDCAERCAAGGKSVARGGVAGDYISSGEESGIHHHAPPFAWSPCGRDIFVASRSDSTIRIHRIW